MLAAGVIVFYSAARADIPQRIVNDWLAQDASGVQLIAPVRRTEPARVDRYGQSGELFRHPYALSEKHFIVGYSPEGWKKGAGFGLYFFTADGRREMLAWDDSIPCSQPVPLARRKVPQRRFEVPARTPVYFQIIDERGCAIQTMRCWSTLQPGERYACIGCHENKNETTLATAAGATLATRKGPRKPIGFYGLPRGFSFPKEIQPILDKHCIRCHDGGKKTDANRKSFSLLSKGNLDRRAKRIWSDSYLAITKR